MTKDEILKLEGRELDAAVAEKAMGWKPHARNTALYVPAALVNDVIIDPTLVQAGVNTWHPASDMNAAWQVVEKADLSVIKIPGQQLYWVGVVEEMEHYGEKGTQFPDFDITNFENFVDSECAPLAICRAALLATLEPPQ